MDESALTQTLALVEKLEVLLAGEFEALKKQDLETFDALQVEKVDILEQLSTLGVPHHENESADLKHLIDNPLWGEVSSGMERCRRAHQRNELLIMKQLDTIRGALSALQNQDPSATLELYTKLGKTQATRRSILSGDA